MKYISTRGNSEPITAAEAIRHGIAPDGGLFVPENFPRYMPEHTLSYGDLALEIFGLYLDDYTEEELRLIVADSYFSGSFPGIITPIITVGSSEILELWHGPTAAFKDIALQALPHLLTYAIRKTGGDKEVVILVATSGDTGKAALEGFKDVDGVRIIVFYPKDGVSPLQERQMLTTGGDNTHVVAVRGNFDDCQTAVKTVFNDTALREAMSESGKEFSSANSINWGRLLPQIVYYFHTYNQLVKRGNIAEGEAVNIVVPTGNFGNILAAYYAYRMGLPVNKFICASNKNNVLTDAIMNGVYDRRREFCRTESPSMDIVVSSNFERMVFELFDRDGKATAEAFAKFATEGFFAIPESIKNMFWGGYADQEKANRTIRKAFSQHGYIYDPHTAVAAAVADEYKKETGDKHHMIIASTASPYKFPASVLDALGADTEGKSEEELLAILSEKSGTEPHRALIGLETLPLKEQIVIDKEQIKDIVIKLSQA